MTEIKLDVNNFEEEVLNSDVPVVVDFWATWCGPCQMQGPIIAKLAEESDGTYKVGKVDVDENGDLARKYRVMSIPTIIVFKNGEVAEKKVGLQSMEELKAMIKK